MYDDLTWAGEVYVFEPTGELIRTIRAPDPSMYAQFGVSLATVGDRLLVGAPGFISVDGVPTGKAYLFDQAGALVRAFTPPAAGPAAFGISLTGLGNHVVIGAFGTEVDGLFRAGRAYVFEQGGALLHTLQAPVPEADGWFGYAVAAAGAKALVGAVSQSAGSTAAAGQAYAFALAPATPPDPVTQIEEVLAEIVDLEADGALSAGQANALAGTLNGALSSIAEGKTTAACGQFGAFVRQVQALVRSGRLSHDEGDALIAAAQSVMDPLCA